MSQQEIDKAISLLLSQKTNLSIKKLDEFKSLRGINNETLLHYCVVESYYELVVKLLESGHSVDVYNKLDKTPLMEAVILDDFKMVEILVRNRADVSAKDREGNTALHLSQEYVSSDKIVQFLLDNGSDNSIKNNYGEIYSDL